MQTSRLLLVLPGLLLSFSTPAALDATARAEIDHLLAYLEQSGCEFYRNGKWYPSPDARAHLDRKYQYLLKKGWVDTAEQFIARAATQSSRSGEAYRVRCPAAAAAPSARWLKDELQRYRSNR
jgi:hypothetical protein